MADDEHNPTPELRHLFVDHDAAERCRREFAEKQAARRREIQRKLRRRREALRRGEKPPDDGPLYS